MPKLNGAVLDALPLAAAEWEAIRAVEQRRHAEAEQASQASQAAVELAATVYRDDPVAWVHDMIAWKDGEGPAPYQDEIMAELPRRQRVAVRGPHGLGKTALESWVLLWYALTRDGEDWKIPTTASAWRQLTKFLWPEVRKWARRLRWDRLGREPFDMRLELQTLGLKLRTGEAFAVASDVPDLIEGAHADRLLYLFDESKTIPEPTFDAAEGAFSTAGTDTAGEAFALAVSTPGEPHGRFYDIHARKAGTEDWWTRHVTLEETIAAGRVSRAWAEQRRRQWGASSAVYKNRVEGEFAASEEDGVIPLAWVELANERWRAWDEAGRQLGPFVAVGVDVGGGSATGDKTILAPRHGPVVPELRRYQHADTMETAGRVKGILDAHGGRAVVDVIGIGAGIVHRLREQRCKVEAFNASERTDRLDRSGELGFANVRSAAWWGLRERLDPDVGEPVALPPDDTLTGDLTAPKWRVLSGGKIQVESKDDLRKAERLGRSTDDGDAVVQAFWEPVTPRPFRAATGGSRPLVAGYRQEVSRS
jgi:hypothetical protein